MDGSVKNGILVEAPGPKFGGKVFYLYRGRRHWVPSEQWIRDMGMRWPEDVQRISEEIAARLGLEKR